MNTRTVSRPDPVSQLAPASVAGTRLVFWAVGLVLAAAQIWVFRHQVSTDSISYLDMSDGVFPGADWHRLINGVWSPLYPFILGITRRIFSIAAPSEIVAAHWLNLGFFLFAFICFEFLLGSVFQRLQLRDESEANPGASSQFPRGSFLILAYSLFLWASIAEISVRNLRPDMLMSGFVYLAVGILLRMQGRGARWKDYIALGIILGVAALAKAPMLPLGMLIILVSLFAVENWRPAVKMAASSLLLLFLIGSLYFVPLSRARGFFTLGQSSKFNYLVNVNHARPEMYLQNPGSARGSFAHPPEKIFSSPPTYAFPVAAQVTYPLRFDPSDWIEGVHPRLVLKRQVAVALQNSRDIALLLLPLCLVLAAVLVLAYFSPTGISRALLETWPVCLVGLVGCAMYLPFHVEPRYVAAFIALLFLGILLGFQVPVTLSRRWLTIGAMVISASLLLPPILQTYTRGVQLARVPNEDAAAAAALNGMGIRPGDRVARISSLPYDIGMERIGRMRISAEVDFEHAREFWSASPATQKELLQLFASHDVRAVIATSPELTPATKAGWTRLGSTPYWAWLPSRTP